MYAQKEKSKESKSKVVANVVSQKKSGLESTFQFVDNRPGEIAQTKLQAMANNHGSQQQHLIQKKESKTILPYNLESGIKNLFGYSMDYLKVHYNPDKLIQLHSQRTDIHIAAGQEKHLPNEVCHVVQHARGRVQHNRINSYKKLLIQRVPGEFIRWCNGFINIASSVKYQIMAYHRNEHGYVSTNMFWVYPEKCASNKDIQTPILLELVNGKYYDSSEKPLTSQSNTKSLESTYHWTYDEYTITGGGLLKEFMISPLDSVEIFHQWAYERSLLNVKNNNSMGIIIPVFKNSSQRTMFNNHISSRIKQTEINRDIFASKESKSVFTGKITKNPNFEELSKKFEIILGVLNQLYELSTRDILKRIPGGAEYQPTIYVVGHGLPADSYPIESQRSKGLRTEEQTGDNAIFDNSGEAKTAQHTVEFIEQLTFPPRAHFVILSCCSAQRNTDITSRDIQNAKDSRKVPVIFGEPTFAKKINDALKAKHKGISLIGFLGKIEIEAIETPNNPVQNLSQISDKEKLPMEDVAVRYS